MSIFEKIEKFNRARITLSDGRIVKGESWGIITAEDDDGEETGSLEDIGKSYEMLAYGIETAKGGINNKLAHEMYRIVKEQK